MELDYACEYTTLLDVDEVIDSNDDQGFYGNGTNTTKGWIYNLQYYNVRYNLIPMICTLITIFILIWCSAYSMVTSDTPTLTNISNTVSITPTNNNAFTDSVTITQNADNTSLNHLNSTIHSKTDTNDSWSFPISSRDITNYDIDYS